MKDLLAKRLKAVQGVAKSLEWYHIGLRPVAEVNGRKMFPAGSIPLGCKSRKLNAPVYTNMRRESVYGNDSYAEYPGQLVKLTPEHARDCKISTKLWVLRKHMSGESKNIDGTINPPKLKRISCFRITEDFNPEPDDELLEDYIYIAKWEPGLTQLPHEYPLKENEVDIGDITEEEISQYARTGMATPPAEMVELKSQAKVENAMAEGTKRRK